jgi:peroxisomal 3,2-trans-enoyl-CoA isomerase
VPPIPWDGRRGRPFLWEHGVLLSSDLCFETLQHWLRPAQFNRPKSLNSFGGNLIVDTVQALRVLDNHPDTVMTVITAVGRFFSSGADVKGRESLLVLPSTKALAISNTCTDSRSIIAEASQSRPNYDSDAVKKLDVLNKINPSIQLISSMIKHRKVLVLAMNGPAVGGGAAWFQGVADIVLASTTTWLQCPFSALALVPEFGSASTFPQSIGVHRANDVLMFGRKVRVEELLQWGMVNRVIEHEGFHDKVMRYLQEQLEINDGKSMMEHKRLMNGPLRSRRLLALYEAADAVSERFVEDAPTKRFAEKSRLLNGN